MRYALLALTLLLTACAAPERTDVVTARGNPVTLEGASVAKGMSAPDARLVGTDMTDMSISDYQGSVVILATVPSLDTGVCSRETQTFNERAAELSDDVIVLTVSMDLPMAQARWCGDNGVDRVVTASDYKYRDVGTAYGLRIKENGLLARAVFVIDRDGTIVYEQIVPELTTEPDYDAALAAAQAAS